MTNAERTLLLEMARALAAEGLIDPALLRAVMPPVVTGLRPRQPLYFDTAANSALAKELETEITRRMTGGGERLARGGLQLAGGQRARPVADAAKVAVSGDRAATVLS